MNSCVQFKLLKCVCHLALVNDFKRVYFKRCDIGKDSEQLKIIVGRLRSGNSSNLNIKKKC